MDDVGRSNVPQLAVTVADALGDVLQPAVSAPLGLGPDRRILSHNVRVVKEKVLVRAYVCVCVRVQIQIYIQHQIQIQIQSQIHIHIQIQIQPHFFLQWPLELK